MLPPRMRRLLMRCKRSLFVTGGLVAALVIGVLSGRDDSPSSGKLAAAGEDKGREADRAAIQKSGRDFTDAFNKGDAKAVAALWTEQGECHDADGIVTRGRAALEKAFTEFFTAN